METQTGKTALVTGATSGIGHELAKLFAQDGYNLVLVARQDDKLREVADQFRQQYGTQQIHTVARDLTDPKAPEEVYDETKRQGLHVDVLVNNVGAGEYGMFANETDLQRELSIIQLNVTSLVHLTKLYLKDMIQKGEGKILNLASVVSIMPNPMMAVYGGTKSFVYSFSEALRNELKDTNITVTALLPGATDTNFFNAAGAEGTRAHKMAQATGDPAAVAKDGYDALMSGKDKIISGFMNKAQVAMGHFMPDQMNASSMRKLMQREGEEERTERSSDWMFPALLAGTVATMALIWAFGRDMSTYDKLKYRYKANRVKNDLLSALSLN
ncbi:SDR family NAD(P)-dependent oxidoreductase [Tellurirhabdus rosea]|uniref:SDR family NAD(P)-dependent oxidoreductase n=1 Tax=Tellurirhabdus rosea TaxID=2674997 RepID=UPI00224F382F|nr:SDR family oxidoreductase [Tellurirhabdus rosea]